MTPDASFKGTAALTVTEVFATKFSSLLTSAPINSADTVYVSPTSVAKALYEPEPALIVAT